MGVLPGAVRAIPVVLNPGAGAQPLLPCRPVDSHVDRVAVIPVNIFLARPAGLKQLLYPGCIHARAGHRPVQRDSSLLQRSHNQGIDHASFVSLSLVAA